MYIYIGTGKRLSASRFDINRLLLKPEYFFQELAIKDKIFSN